MLTFCIQLRSLQFTVKLFTNQPKDPAIVIIGGGTGSFNLLRSLKSYTSHLTALVNMADSGGSSGILRDELGVLPPGDVRQCLVALSTAPEELRGLFNFRFPEGSLQGHSFGNLFLSAAERMTGNFEEAIRLGGEVLRIHGRVIPITLDNCQLVLQEGDQTIVGEYRIAYQTDFSGFHKPSLSLQPAARLNQAGRQAILEADLVVIAPSDLYAALSASLLVEGVGEALQATPAKIAFVANLVNKPQHTRGFAVHDYAREIERFAGADILDYVLYNTDEPEPELLSAYALEHEFPVGVEAPALAAAHYTALGGAFLSRAEYRADTHDAIPRSLIRHDGEATARALLSLLKS